MVKQSEPRRSDVRDYPVTGGRVEVYRRSDDDVSGIGVSLVVGRRELIRWGLQEGESHERIDVGKAPLLYFPRDMSLYHAVELTCDQIVQHTNAVAYMTRQPRLKDRQLREASDWAREQIADLLGQEESPDAEAAEEAEAEDGAEQDDEDEGAADDPSLVREWARQNDMECSAKGPLPHAVLEAYRARG